MGFGAVIFLYLAVQIASTAIVVTKPEAKFKEYLPTPDDELLEQDKHFWFEQGKTRLRKMIALDKQPELKVAKNVIIFIGDGMGVSTITSSRIYKGQRWFNKSGEEHVLSYEAFPNVALVKTYNVDKQVPDSAGTATALFSGVKTRFEAIGVDVNSRTDKLTEKFEASKLDSLMTWAQQEGKATGIVTTTRITHATPSATYAHSNYRYKECDTQILEEEKALMKDIARQLVEDAPGKNFKVILGGGQSHLGYLREGKCTRQDGYNLTDVWLKSHAGSKSILAVDNEGLDAVDDDTEYLLGLFSNDNMPFALLRDQGPKGTPSLEKMTRRALQVLRKSDKGFVLMVEGGMIDQAHHKNYARMAMEEAADFDDAVSLAVDETGSDTLILVTADHSHSFTMNGYGPRGNDIMGLSTTSDYKPQKFPTLSYANGPSFKYHYTPGAKETFPWRNPVTDENRLNDPKYQSFSGIQLNDETHGGEDVAIFAKGPQSHLVRGVIEQNYVAHVVSYAACVGPHKGLNEDCEKGPGNSAKDVTKSTSFALLVLLLSCGLIM